ncbi:MAG TPA: putative toxin-antitoxin system toxin component, PIN family [Pedobacter sp.]|jgi:putative PIN family toxin of toxin-antitoxin system
MVSKIFLDANVCLSFLLQRKGYEPSESIFERVILNQYKAYTSPAIIHIIAYYLRKIHSSEITKKLIISLLSTVKVIDCNHEITIIAVNSQMTDIEDALQYYTAMHHQIDHFISLDKNLIKSAIPVLPVYSPEDFLKEFE